MPERLPRVTGTDALRALRRAGWASSRQVGSHVQLRHALLPGRVTVPVHAGEVLHPKTLRSILAQARITVEEFRQLL